jgi:predicted dehydrogenase
MSIDKKITFALVGFGYWGKIIARNITENKFCELKYIVDGNVDSLKLAKDINPKSTIINDLKKVLNDDDVDVVAIITPPSEHYDVAVKCLDSNKNILVTKPICLKSEDAIDLKHLAEINKRHIFVDDTFLFSEPVMFLKKYIQENSLADKISFIQSSRINLGLMQSDCNVIWDLAPHDIGIINYILNDTPTKVRATGIKPFKNYKYDCHSTSELVFREELHASLTLSWLSAIKTRRMIIGSSQNTIVYDHLDEESQIKIFDHSINYTDLNKDTQFKYHTGEVLIPKLNLSEPLKNEIKAIVDTLLNNKNFPIDVNHAINTVKIIEALNKSLSKNGDFIKL